MKTAIGYIYNASTQEDRARQITAIRKDCREFNYILLEIKEEEGTIRKGLPTLSALGDAQADILIVGKLTNKLSAKDLLSFIQVLYQVSLKKSVYLNEGRTTFDKQEDREFAPFMAQVSRIVGCSEKKESKRKGIQDRLELAIQEYPMLATQPTPPYGFKNVLNPNYDGTDKSIPKYLLEAVPEQIKMVKKVFKYALKGYSFYHISELLSALKCRTCKGNRISESQVAAILHNPLFIGKREYMGQMYETGEKYVNENVWQEVQEQIAQRTNGEEKTSKFYMLGGVYTCACGGSIHYRKSKAGLLYCCARKDIHHKRLDGGCQFYGIRAKMLNEIVWQDLLPKQALETYAEATSKKIENRQVILANARELANEYDSRWRETRKVLEEERARANFLQREDPVRKQKIESLQAKVDKLAKSYFDQDQKARDIAGSITYEQVTLRERTLARYTDMEKKAIIAQQLKRVEYISRKSGNGFVILQYEDGTEVFYAVVKREKTRVYRLRRESFYYNSKEKTLHIKMLHNTISESVSPKEVLEKEHVIMEVTELLNL